MQQWVGVVISTDKFNELACAFLGDADNYDKYLHDQVIMDNFATLLWQKFRVHRDVDGGAHVFLAIPADYELLEVSKARGYAVNIVFHDSSAERDRIAKETLVALIGVAAAEQWKYGFWLFGYSN